MATTGKTIALLVKGDRFCAAREAVIRGIPFVYVTEHEHPVPRETLGRTGAQFRDLVAQWFGEPSEVIPGFGYPNGTLLLFGEGGDEA